MAIVGRSIPNVPIVSRGSFADDPVLTTPKPIVVATPTRPRTAVVITGRSSLVDVAVAAEATPGPLVVVPRGRARAGLAIVARAHLADDPVLTTPAPLVVTPAPWPRRGYVATARGSLFDAATPQPIVVTRPTKRVDPPPILIFRTAPAEAPVADATPPPVVIVASRRLPGSTVLLLRNPAEAGPYVTPVKAASAPTVASANASDSAVTAARTSTSAITARATSSGGVT